MIEEDIPVHSTNAKPGNKIKVFDKVAKRLNGKQCTKPISNGETVAE